MINARRLLVVGYCGEIEGRVSELQAKCGEVESRLNDLIGRLMEAESRILALEASVSSLSGRVSDLENKFPTFRSAYQRVNTERTISSGSIDPDLQITWDFNPKPTLIIAYVGWIEAVGGRWFLRVGSEDYGICQVNSPYFSGTVAYIFESMSGSKLVTLYYLCDSGMISLSKYGYYRSLNIIELRE